MALTVEMQPGAFEDRRDGQNGSAGVTRLLSTWQVLPIIPLKA
jgi:hypothetical protein